MSAKTFLTAAVLLWDGSGSFGRPVTGTSQAYMPDSVHDMDEPIGPSASPEVGKHLAEEAPEVRGQVADGGFVPGLPDARACVFSHRCIVFPLFFTCFF